MKGMKKMLTLSPKGQITLPKKARLAIGLQPGQRLVVESIGKNTITLRRVKDTDEFRGVLKNVLQQDAVGLIRELRDKDWQENDRV